jgi:hypothetical protein
MAFVHIVKWRERAHELFFAERRLLRTRDEVGHRMRDGQILGHVALRGECGRAHGLRLGLWLPLGAPKLKVPAPVPSAPR